jgi:hypothetical protein
MVKLPDPYALGEGPGRSRRPQARIDASAIAEGAESLGRSVARGGAALAEATGAGGEAIARALAPEAEYGRAVSEGGASRARVLRSLGEAEGRAVSEGGASRARVLRSLGEAEGTAVARAGRSRGRALEEAGATLGGAQTRAGRELAGATERVGEAAGRGIRQASEAEGGAIQRGGQAIASAIERGAEMERRGFAQLGEGMARFAKGAQDYVDAEFRLDLARARANFITEQTILDGAFDRDTDYATLRERYRKEIGAIRERSAALIRSPRLREQFMLESQDNVARGLVRAERHALKLETIDKRAELETRLENLRESALIKKEDDRGDTIAAGAALIDESQAAGYYTPTEAQDRKREWVESYAAAWTESRPPEQRLNLLNQAEEGKATGTPVDFLKPGQVLDLHRRATTELLQEQLRAESEAALARRAVLDKVNDDLRSMANTGQGVPGLEPETVERVLGSARFLEWQARREDAHAIWVNTHDLYSLSEQQIDARLESLRPAPGAENDSRLQRIHDEVARQVEQLRRLRREDPALSVGNDPMVQDAAMTVDPQQPATFRPLAMARLAAQERAGIPEELRLPITKDEAVRLTEPLRRAPPGQERDVLTDIATQFQAMFGDHADRAFDYALQSSAEDTATGRRERVSG